MKVKRVIVDEMPKSCFDCTCTSLITGVCYARYELTPASGNIPDWCPLEVETDVEAPKEVKGEKKLNPCPACRNEKLMVIVSGGRR